MTPFLLPAAAAPASATGAASLAPLMILVPLYRVANRYTF